MTNHRARLGLYVILAALCLLPSFVSQPAHAQDYLFYPASSREIYYFGRVARASEMLWTWAGTGFRVGYANSQAVGLHLSAPNHSEDSSQAVPRLLWYRRNGEAWQSLLVPAGADQVFPLTLSGGEGALEVMKASEGRLIFKGLQLNFGGVLTGPPVPAYKIEIVGDSVSVGFRVNGVGGYETPEDHDARTTYGWQLGSIFNAEVRFIAITGHGLTHNYNTPPALSTTMPAYYGYLQRQLGTENNWAWQPDLIIVNLGTNDATDPIADDATITQAYSKFLATLRGLNPKAKIVALQPFGFSNGDVAVYPAAIAQAVAARQASGDSAVFYLNLGRFTAADFTDGVHPNPAGHNRAAGLIAPFLREIMGW
jgi:lysophospholipase L1-like esterase